MQIGKLVPYNLRAEPKLVPYDLRAERTRQFQRKGTSKDALVSEPFFLAPGLA